MPKTKATPLEAARFINAEKRIAAAADRLTQRIAGSPEDFFEPLRLRMDLNAQGIGHAALVELLIERGVIGPLDYFEKLADCMEHKADEADEADEADSEPDDDLEGTTNARNA